MAKETLGTRVARLEELHADLSEKVAVLLDAQIKTEARFQRTDERIADLVSAIGALNRQMQNGKR